MFIPDLPRDSVGDLLARTGNGDGKAFADLYLLYAARLLWCALKIVKRRELAEDVLQESFMAIWKDAGKFDCTRGAALTWMVTIVRNKAVDLLRANQMKAEFLSDGVDDRGELQDRSRGPCEQLEHQQCRTMIERGLATLHAPQRRAIELAFFAELTHGEVACEMTLPLGTVKTSIRRGCRTLRTRVQRLE